MWMRAIRYCCKYIGRYYVHTLMGSIIVCIINPKLKQRKIVSHNAVSAAYLVQPSYASILEMVGRVATLAVLVDVLIPLLWRSSCFSWPQLLTLILFNCKLRCSNYSNKELGILKSYVNKFLTIRK